MHMRVASMVLALAAAACDRSAQAPDAAPAPAALDAPSPNAETARAFQPVNESARPFGVLTVAMSLRLPDDPAADATDVLTLRAANGLIVEGVVVGAISPSTQVQGQTLRALLDIPVEEPIVFVYRVTAEARAEGVAGLCGAESPSHVVVWEPAGPGDPVIKVLGVLGGAPGAAGARQCVMLEFRRG